MRDVKKKEPGNERQGGDVASSPVSRQRNEDKHRSKEGRKGSGNRRHTGGANDEE